MTPMKNTPDAKPTAETDDRFPSGEWKGFFQQPKTRRHEMTLNLGFCEGRLHGDGVDCVGDFELKGRYDLNSGEVWIHKAYRMHRVIYKGFNEGKGIWGIWELPGQDKGGFHIWPKGMRDPTINELEAHALVPVEAKPLVVVAE